MFLKFLLRAHQVQIYQVMNATVLSNGNKMLRIAVPRRYSLRMARVLMMGAFGPVCKAMDTVKTEHVAIEIINCHAENSNQLVKLLRHIKLQRLFSGHPNVILRITTPALYFCNCLCSELLTQILQLVNICQDPFRKELFVVTGHSRANLSDVQLTSQGQPDDLLKSIAQQLLEVVRALHTVGIVHFAIKPDEIFLHSSAQLRLTGFHSAAVIGTARRASAADDLLEWWHRAPEVLLSSSHPYAASMDVYSVGCVLAELVLDRLLFGRASFADHIAAMLRLQGFNGVQDLGFEPDAHAANIIKERCVSPPRKLATTFPTVSLELCDLLSKLLEVNPKERITAEEALRHPFFSTQPIHHAVAWPVQLTPPPADFFAFEVPGAFSEAQLQQLISDEAKGCETELGQDVFDPLHLPLSCR